MTTANKLLTAPYVAANDNGKPRGCTWTAIIKAMRTVSPAAERAAWMGRRQGWTAAQFVDRMIAADTMMKWAAK